MAGDGMHDPFCRQVETNLPAIRIAEDRSGLAAVATLLPDRAPANAAFLWDFFVVPRQIPAIHAMWTGPEISAPIPDAELTPEQRAAGLPLEQATVMPQPGEIVLTYLPPRVWGGGPAPVFDIGLFYGPGARLFFPIGWQPGSVVARIEDVPAFAAACARIRQTGACTLLFARQP
jgi:Protein of unknown function (DUF3830)